MLGSPKMDRVPIEERRDFPLVGARARCLNRFERDPGRYDRHDRIAAALTVVGS